VTKSVQERYPLSKILNPCSEGKLDQSSAKSL